MIDLCTGSVVIYAGVRCAVLDVARLSELIDLYTGTVVIFAGVRCAVLDVTRLRE